MEKITLLHMKTNQKAVVARIEGGISLQNRLMSMGIYPGKEITKLSHFVLKGPVTVRTGRAVIALGHGVAGKIIIKE